MSPRYAAALAGSTASAVLVPPALAEAAAGPAARVVVPDPYGAMVRIIRRLFPPTEPRPGIDPTARIGPDPIAKNLPSLIVSRRVAMR